MQSLEGKPTRPKFYMQFVLDHMMLTQAGKDWLKGYKLASSKISSLFVIFELFLKIRL